MCLFECVFTSGRVVPTLSKTMTLSLRLVVLGALCLAYCGGASKLAAKAGLDDEAAVAAAAFKEDTLASNMLPEQEPPHVTKGPGKPAKPTKPPAAKIAPTAAKGPRNECKCRNTFTNVITSA